MKKNSSLVSDLFNMDVLFGLLLGSAVPFLMWVFMQADEIKGYQSLIAGSMALFGAAIALIAVMHQIRHAQELEGDRLARRMYAARAMMPHALSALSSYAKKCCTQLQRACADVEPPELEGDVWIPEDLTVPKTPDEAMATIKECLEFGNPAIQVRLREYIKFQQIQYSRLNGQKKGDTVQADYYYALLNDAIEVYARCSMLFDYSRGDDETVPGEPEIGNLKNAADICGFYGARWDTLYQTLGRV